MDTTSDHRAAELFAAAVKLAGEQREAFLIEHCANDAGLLARIRQELEDHDRELDVNPLRLPGDAGHDHEEAVVDRTGSALIGETIGGYQVLGILGDGAMGVVYLAEQQRPRRTVALKVIRPGLVSRQTLRRFEHEVELLGRLRHPGIAQIFDAGTAQTKVGPQPFYAMEHVEGCSLVEHAAAHDLDVNRRLSMMIQICEAVHAAHERGVIHRDLKPSNILVDGSGNCKIVDFGVARATDAGVATTIATTSEHLVGTLQYMSPEQVSVLHPDLDRRSDVYTLGVLLNELLSGRLPYDLRLKPMPEIARIISEDDPVPLRSLDASLRGDIETIVLKALDKERARRYQTAAEMADDIRRYLKNEPIRAKPASALYQFRKFARRNPGFVSAVTAATIMTFVGSMLAITAIMQKKHRTEAEEIADQVLKMNVLFRHVGGYSDEEFIAACEEWEAARGSLNPTVEVMLREMMGMSCYAVERYKDAEAHLLRHLALLRRMRGPTHPSTLRSVDLVHCVLRDMGDLEGSEALLRGSLAQCAGLPGTDQRQLLDSEACGLALRILRLRYVLGDTLHYLGRFREAEVELRETLEGMHRTLTELNRLQPDKPAIDPDAHDGILEVRVSLGSLLADSGQVTEALSLLRNVVAAYDARGDLHRPHPVHARAELGLALLAAGRPEESRRLLAQVLEEQKDLFGPDHLETLKTRGYLGRALLLSDQCGRAEELLRETVGHARRKLPGHWLTAVFRSDQGECLLARGEHDGAEALLLDALAELQHLFSDRDYRAQRTITTLARLYDAWGRPEEAARYRQRKSPPARRRSTDRHALSWS